MAGPTLDCPDLYSVCLLDQLGLTVTGQLLGEGDTVLACRVPEPDDVAEHWLFVAKRSGPGVTRLLSWA